MKRQSNKLADITGDRVDHGFGCDLFENTRIVANDRLGKKRRQRLGRSLAHTAAE
ncbi:MAG: hypothetical protein OXR62_12430 [Ahrensia sp.]|nr:hypothetical protein [Ahrensia sp.]